MNFPKASSYGWASMQTPRSCDVVAPMVIKIVKSLGVSTVLDVGCGNGALCGLLKREGLDVAGTECDEEGYEKAKQTYPGIPFFNRGVYDSADTIMRARKQPFDCVVSTEVIEHLYAPRHLPAFAAQVLCPTGYLVLSTPYHGFLKNMALSIMNHWDAHHCALWEGGHIKFWSRKTVCQLLEENGFRVVSFHGVGRVPFLWKSMVVVARKSEVKD